MKEWITVKQACTAAEMRHSTFQYWLKTRPMLAKHRPGLRKNCVDVNATYFLKLCTDKYASRQNGIGRALQMKSPQEIIEALQKLD